MAGDWLKCNFDLWDHRCVQGVAHALSLDADTVVGKLMRLWAWAQKQTANGRVEPCTVAIVDATARQEGFALAMESVGWLEVGDGWVRFLRWEKHNGNSAKRRLKESSRKAEYRERTQRKRVPCVSRPTRDKSGTVPALEQSRAEQSGASAPLERRAEQSRQDSPSAEDGPRPAVLGVLEQAGLSRMAAIATHAKAQAGGISDEQLTHAAARCADERGKGNEIKNPQNYVESIVGLRDSVPRKLADRRAAIRQQAQTARSGDPR